LKRFEKIKITPELPLEAGDTRVVFFIRGQREELSTFREIAGRLADLGYRPIILVSGHSVKAPFFEWSARVPIIRIASFDNNTLPWLGEFEFGITSANEKVPVWAGGRQQINWDDRLSGEANLEQILISLGARILNAARPVIFLERVLWGGGAERVIYDIVRNLDRRLYRPVVMTMFDEHCMGPDFPADVEVINIRKNLFDAVTGDCLPHADAQTKDLIVIKRSVRWLRRFYHNFLSQDLRRRIGIGRLIFNLRGILSSPKLYVGKLCASTVEVSIQNGSSVNPTTLDMDFINAMAQHNLAADGLAKSIRKFGSNSVLVAVMEEASVTAWLAQAAGRFPYILSLHTYESLCLPTIYPTPSRCKAEKWLLSSACKDATGVVLPTRGCASDLVDNFDVHTAEIKTIWNPIDCAQIRRQSWCQINEVSAWLRSADKFRIVHVGRLDKQKNHELLLQACFELKRRGRDFSLVIVGGGQDGPWIERQIQEQGLQHHVFLAGEQKNPFPWMAAADALLLTSRFEAFALVLVEAMVCGAAVISVDCPCGPGEVLANGKYGLLVPNDDCGAIATAVERLMDDDSLKESLVQSGYLRAEDFDVKNIIPQWEALIDAVPH
jgi:glycosyltransferase involved in cell wall biosynthesis